MVQKMSVKKKMAIPIPESPVSGGVPLVVPDAFEVSWRRLILHDELREPEKPEVEVLQVSLLVVGYVLKGKPRPLAAIFSKSFRESNRFAMPRRKENV